MFPFGKDTTELVKTLTEAESNLRASLPPADFRRITPLNQRQKRKRNRQNANSKFNRK